MDCVAKELPEGSTYSLIHVHSHPKRARRLIFTRKDDQSLSVQSTHLFILTHESLPVLALEALIDEAPEVCTLFISKADTAGWYDGPPLKTSRVIEALIELLLKKYINHAKPTRIAVFAYSQPEYLFLGSQSNPKKHILTDSQLVKWWIRCFDALVPREFASVSKACLRIPGEEGPLKPYFPSNASLKWTNGDIYWKGPDPEAEDAVPAILRIPRFPDDPKTRFLENIYLEKRAKKVSRRQFWIELQSRQEFRLNKSMGIIGVEGYIKPSTGTNLVDSQNPLTEAAAPAVAYKDLLHFKETLLDNDFSTREAASEAIKEIEQRTPDGACIEMTGRLARKPDSSKSPNQEPQPIPVKRVTVLGGGLVRKKQRT